MNSLHFSEENDKTTKYIEDIKNIDDHFYEIMSGFSDGCQPLSWYEEDIIQWKNFWQKFRKYKEDNPGKNLDFEFQFNYEDEKDIYESDNFYDFYDFYTNCENDICISTFEPSIKSYYYYYNDHIKSLKFINFKNFDDKYDHPPTPIYLKNKYIFRTEYSYHDIDDYRLHHSWARFYDYNHCPFIYNCLLYNRNNKNYHNTIKKLRNYIKANPDFFNYFLVGMEINGNIIIYEKALIQDLNDENNFLAVIRNTPEVKPYFDRGFKIMNQKIARFNDENYLPPESDN